MSDDKERQSSDAHRSHDESSDMLPDPDAHLTAAEREEAVSLTSRPTCPTYRRADGRSSKHADLSATTGPKAGAKAGLAAYAMGTSQPQFPPGHRKPLIAPSFASCTFLLSWTEPTSVMRRLQVS